jgi:hypothetical protein
LVSGSMAAGAVGAPTNTKIRKMIQRMKPLDQLT